ncbi:hypothetical protein PGT21_001592 [Puccinia graminis f. sp. tritici]|nr:hypothetical protein PGT21_001592 [Puccinia graminis f. sp. tritici]
MTIAVPSEVIASAIVVEYWKTPVNKAVWVTLFIVLGCAINFLGVRWYGETEFAFAAVKVVAVVILILVGIVIDLGLDFGKLLLTTESSRSLLTAANDALPLSNLNRTNLLHAGILLIPDHSTNYMRYQEPTVFLQATYSYMGTEMVAITAGEAANPRKTVPKAIERVFYRILVFYLGSTLTVGLLVPSSSPDLLGGTGDASSSPFVIAIKAAGITVLPDLINVVILVSAISAASSKLSEFCSAFQKMEWHLEYSLSATVLGYPYGH